MGTLPAGHQGFRYQWGLGSSSFSFFLAPLLFPCCWWVNNPRERIRMAVTVMTTGVRDELGPRRRGLGHPRRPGREGKRGGDRCGCALQQGGSRGAASSCTNTTACMDRGCRRPGVEGACSISTARAVAERSSDLIFTSLFTRHIFAHNMYFNTYSFFFATFHHSNIYIIHLCKFVYASPKSRMVHCGIL